MRESDKGMKGDHRNISDPSADRKDFIKHVADNAAKEATKDGKNKFEDLNKETNKEAEKEKLNIKKH